MRFRSFDDAKTFVHSLDLKNREEWKKYCRSGKKPNDIPSKPNSHYKDKGWVSWGDWLGTNTIASQNRQYRSFNEAREFARSLNLSSGTKWEEYIKNNKLPTNIPKYPYEHYKDKGWVSWGDWLGTKTVAPQNRRYRSFNEAREFARSLHLSGGAAWEEYSRSGKRPNDIPTAHDRVYKDK
ncbi:MAG TPA: hypothetical protein VJ697_02835 [Nitrososphaeraceae archaeon]|nr:hypothetical protein [Nitrososphaeraceae archaeon]